MDDLDGQQPALMLGYDDVGEAELLPAPAIPEDSTGNLVGFVSERGAVIMAQRGGPDAGPQEASWAVVQDPAGEFTDQSGDAIVPDELLHQFRLRLAAGAKWPSRPAVAPRVSGSST